MTLRFDTRNENGKISPAPKFGKYTKLDYDFEKFCFLHRLLNLPNAGIDKRKLAQYDRQFKKVFGMVPDYINTTDVEVKTWCDNYENNNLISG